MKNKISMELQDPIIQQGFEIICKQLTEKNKYNKILEECNGKLHKEVEELKEELCKQIKTISTEAKRIRELEAQVEKMKVCSNCKHFNNLDDLEYCQNCERQLVNSLDKLPREEIIKDEWELKE